MNNDSHAPLYAAIYQKLLARIRAAEADYRHKLPSERELMTEFHTTRVTLRIALSQLEREGIIYRSNRRGWFVSPAKLCFDPTARFNFSACAMQQGRVPSTELLSAAESACRNKEQGEKLGLGRGDKMICLERRRSIDERLVLLESIELNSALVPGLLGHDLAGSITTILGDFYGIEVKREEVSIKPTALNREQAELLGVADGSFCIFLQRTRFNQHEQPIEYDREWWLHNAIEIQVTVER
ncbi:MAG: UTRA domain-containing protein [Cellvibrionaceae bacterium]|nr:UTRA domain-containing protein [Cellvibrionaceae bacterium]MCV6627446.1 UTRA domain-containing protein [Cellvibrionaceae bacterium]